MVKRLSIYIIFLCAWYFVPEFLVCTAASKNVYFLAFIIFQFILFAELLKDFNSLCKCKMVLTVVIYELLYLQVAVFQRM